MRTNQAFVMAVVSIFGSANIARSSGADLDRRAYDEVAVLLSQIASAPVVIAEPGLVVDPTYTSTSNTDVKAVSLQMGALAKSNFFFTPANDLFDIYKSVLTDAEWATIPLDSFQRTTLKAAHDRLYSADGSGYTSDYQRYLDLKAIYEAAEAKFEAQPPDNVDPVIQNARDQAETNLNLKGHRDIYEPAELSYKALTDQASYEWRDSDIQAIHTASSGLSPLSTAQPSFDNLEETSWTHVRVTSAQIAQLGPTSSFAATLTGPSVPPWWAPVPDQSMQSTCSPSFPGGDLSLDFDAVVLPIARPWYDPAVFASRAWRWASPGSVISDGTLESNSGTAPLLLISVVAIKNLTIAGAAIGDCLDMVRQASRSRKAVSFGPFSLASTVSGGAFFLPPVITGHSVFVPSLQIIGYGVAPVPLAPNPNDDFRPRKAIRGCQQNESSELVRYEPFSCCRLADQRAYPTNRS